MGKKRGDSGSCDLQNLLRKNDFLTFLRMDLKLGLGHFKTYILRQQTFIDSQNVSNRDFACFGKSVLRPNPQC